MSINFGILIVSDRSSRSERPDLSGPAIAEIITLGGWVVNRMAIVPDEMEEIRALLSDWADGGEVDIILTTGGTGFARRDVTPEATNLVVDRQAPGLAEAMRQESRKITPHAMLSRSIAGIRGKVLIINLPGSPKAAIENLQVVLPVLPHAVELLRENPEAEEHHQAPLATCQ
jgi:molybdopterin adenylyltransferase